MDADLFSYTDAAALLAIRAATATRSVQSCELRALFEAKGLVPREESSPERLPSTASALAPAMG